MTKQIHSMAELRRILFPIFIQYDIKKAIIFGSYGKSQATEKSDVDLLVDSGLKGLRFIGMSEDMRNALDKEVDVLDVMHIESESKIDREIKDTGVLLYEK